MALRKGGGLRPHLDGLRGEDRVLLRHGRGVHRALHDERVLEVPTVDVDRFVGRPVDGADRGERPDHQGGDPRIGLRTART